MKCLLLDAGELGKYVMKAVLITPSESFTITSRSTKRQYNTTSNSCKSVRASTIAMVRLLLIIALESIINYLEKPNPALPKRQLSTTNCTRDLLMLMENS